MKHLITIIFILSGITFRAQNTEWTVASSSVTFKIKNAGFTVDGSLRVQKAKIIFDTSKSYHNSIEAIVDAKTINTGNSARDEHLKKEEYFNIEKYPDISLKASLFTKEASGSYKGFFKLTIKNITKDVIVPFTFTEKDGKGSLKGSFTIDRLDYSVGTSSMILSDKVTVMIDVTVLKKI